MSNKYEQTSAEVDNALSITEKVIAMLPSLDDIEKESELYQHKSGNQMAIERIAFTKGALWFRSMFLKKVDDLNALSIKKVFIFSICTECNEPFSIINPCAELGYNNFPSTNFHGELSIEETEQLRQELINSLIEEKEYDKADMIKNTTRVMEVTFNCAVPIIT